MLTVVVRAMHPRKVFRISRAARTEVSNVFLRIAADGVIGYGEAAPNAFYGESAADVRSRLEDARELVAGMEIETVEDIARIWHEAWCWFAPSRAAQCALDLALWDWLAKKQGISVCELAFAEQPKPVGSFCTIGISAQEEFAEKAAELQGFPFIKLKSDRRAELEPVRYLRESTGAAIAVDANCAWAEVDIAAVSREMANLGVVFLEQPLPPDADVAMAEKSLASELPVIADESCVVQGDIEHLTGRFAGFNIKLVKCGGLTPALAMLRRGRELGLRTMVGCMLESSLGIAAGCVVAQHSDYADLDGAWLLRDDPFAGPTLTKGMILPSGPGFGVRPAPGLFPEDS